MARIDEASPGAPAAGGHWLTSRELVLLLVLAAVQFTHVVDFMIIMPLLPIFRTEMGLSPWQFSAVVSAYTISAGAAGILAARFLDRFDRKTTLLTLYGGFTVGTFLCAVVPSYELLLAARTVAGAFGGLVAATVFATVGDAFPDSRRGTAMGVVMSAFSVASIAGLPMGLQLAESYGWRSTFAVLAGLSALVLLFASGTLPSLRGHLQNDDASEVSAWAVFADPNHLRAFALSSVLVLSTFMLAPSLPTFLEASVGVDQTDLKYMYLCGGLATLVTMTLFGRLADRFGKLRVFRILALFTLIPILVVTNLPTGVALPLVLAVTTIFMISTSGRMVPAMALITASSAPAYRGSFMSFNTAVQQLAAGLATLVAGLILEDGEGGVLNGMTIVGLLSCLVTLISVYLAGRLHKDPGGELAPDSLADDDEFNETALAEVNNRA